jgi:homocysteine S-methyltransferase
MINCAHPDHFSDVLQDEPWMRRIQGLIVNASRCSHAELDEAEELDEGDPNELAGQLMKLRKRFPQIKVVGGCCGTDIRHLTEIAKAI